MPRNAKFTKLALAEHLSPIFQYEGYAGATLSDLAKACDLSKASLYHHFPGGKHDMAEHVLGLAGQRLQKLILAPLVGEVSPNERLEASLEGVSKYYDGNVPICLMNSLMMGQGLLLFGEQINDSLNVWTAALKDLFIEDGYDEQNAARNALIVIQDIQGSLILSRVAQSRSPLEEALVQLKDTFLSE